MVQRGIFATRLCLWMRNRVVVLMKTIKHTANARVFDNDRHLWHPGIIQMPEYADKSAELLR